MYYRINNYHYYGCRSTETTKQCYDSELFRCVLPFATVNLDETAVILCRQYYIYVH